MNTRHKRVLRIVEGSVRNAAHAHNTELPTHFARSVAKRAAGTLMAQWPEVLTSPRSERYPPSHCYVVRGISKELWKVKRDNPELMPGIVWALRWMKEHK